MIFYSHLTLKYYFLLSFFLFLFFLYQFHSFPFSDQTLTSTVNSSSSHRRHWSSPSHHRRFIILLPFIFFLSSSTPHRPNSLAPRWAISPSLSTQALSPKSKLTYADASRPLRPILASLLYLGNQFLQSLLVGLQVSCLCLLHHVMLRVFYLGFLLPVC